MEDRYEPPIPLESPVDGTPEVPPRGGARVAENLARIGVALRCQRVELYGVTTDDTVRLDAWWAALDHPNPSIPPNTEPIPLAWFPWNLGKVFALHYMFVRNADALMSHPNDPLDVGDLGFASVLHVALKRDDRPMGSVCCFWSEERPNPGEWSWSAIVELGLDALYRIA